MKKDTATLSAVVEKLDLKLFGSKREPYLMHQLKKLLSTEARKETRKHLADTAIIVYSDYSKGII